MCMSSPNVILLNLSFYFIYLNVSLAYLLSGEEDTLIYYMFSNVNKCSTERGFVCVSVGLSKKHTFVES